MKIVNNLMKVPELAKVMQDMSKGERVVSSQNAWDAIMVWKRQHCALGWLRVQPASVCHPATLATPVPCLLAARDEQGGSD